MKEMRLFENGKASSMQHALKTKKHMEIPVVDKNGRPVMDSSTGKQLMEIVFENSPFWGEKYMQLIEE